MQTFAALVAAQICITVINDEEKFGTYDEECYRFMTITYKNKIVEELVDISKLKQNDKGGCCE